jgi:AraC-like DNA-binding protein
MAGYLNSHIVAATCDADEMRHMLVNVYDARAFHLTSEAAGFAAQAGYFDFGTANLSYCSYGAPVRLDFRDDAYLRLQFCLTGSGRAKLGAREVDVDANAVVCSPAEAQLDFGARFEQFALRIDRDALERDVVSLLGTRPRERVAFGASADYGAAQTRRLREIVVSAAVSLDLSSEPIPAPLLREIERTIRLAALYGAPSNVSGLLQQEEKSAAPWQVARVEEWIDANWREDISIEKLAAITGAGARSIFLTFRKARGYTPMAYLKTVRLNAARTMLQAAEPGTSVTSVSFACNFMNSSHFARDYSRHFGELPSATLLRARAAKA